MLILPKTYFKQQLDKLKFKIPNYCCNLPDNLNPKGACMGIIYKKVDTGVIFEISGKIFATPTSLGYITEDNIHLMPEKIYKYFQISIDGDYLFNEAAVYRADAVIDAIFDDELNYYISETREIARGKSNKYEITQYGKLKYIHGLTLIPKTQRKIRFIVYSKGIDLRKARNKEYRKIFDCEFLELTNKILRFEYQIGDFKNMRKEFGISEYVYPTISSILTCKRNVVADFFDQIISLKG